MRVWVLAALGGFALIHGAMAAQPIDCSGPIAQADKAIAKITGDLQGMDKMMPKSEMTELHHLVGQAQKLAGQARQGCKEHNSAYEKAQAIARADAASGYATAADVLHFHYMEPGAGGMKGMQKGVSAMPATGGMQQKTPGTGGMQNK
jgi:hypothetical protein